MFYNTEALLTSAKNSEFFPTGQSTFDDTMLIGYGSEELQIRLVPHIMRTRQQFFKCSEQISIVANLRRYTIPERAIGTTFRTLFYVPNAADPDTRYPMTKLNSEDILSDSFSGSTPFGYDLSGDEVILVPKPTTASGAILFIYYRRPSQLIATTSCAKITGVSSVGGVTTFNVDTDLSASLSAGSLIDLNSGKSPFLSWADDVAIQTITSTQIAVATADVSDESGAIEPIVNDYISPAKYSNLPQLPSEYHSILAELIAWRAIKATGAKANLDTCGANIKDMLEQAATLIENRVETSPDLIFERNGLMSAMGGTGFTSFTR